MTYNLFNVDLIEDLYYLKIKLKITNFPLIENFRLAWVKYYKDFCFGDKILFTPLTAQKN